MDRIYRLVNGLRTEIPQRVPSKRYAMDGVGDYRELSPAEEAARDAEEAAFAARKAAEAGQPPPKTLSEQMLELKLEMLSLTQRVKALDTP